MLQTLFFSRATTSRLFSILSSQQLSFEFDGVRFMDQLNVFEALLFPSDGESVLWWLIWVVVPDIIFDTLGRPPSLVQLMTRYVITTVVWRAKTWPCISIISPMPNTHHASYTTSPTRMPHPEVYMDYVSKLFNFITLRQTLHWDCIRSPRALDQGHGSTR